MGNLVIATPILSDVATLTAGSQIPSMPAANLLRRQPGDRWRSDELGSLSLTIDLGAAAAINFVGLLYHNGTQSAQWQIRAAADAGDLVSSPGYNSTAINMWAAGWPADQAPLHALLWLGASPQTFRHWRIDVTDAGNPAGHFEAGRLYVSAAYQLPGNKNITYGWPLQWVDPSPKDRSDGGQLYPQERTKWRELSFSLDFQTESEMYDEVYELQRRRGGSRDVFVMRDPDATTHLLRQSVYGVVKELRPIAHVNYNRFKTEFTIEEMLP